jgi:hypothetical protein
MRAGAGSRLPGQTKSLGEPTDKGQSMTTITLDLPQGKLNRSKLNRNQVRGLLQAPIDAEPQMRCWLDRA